MVFPAERAVQPECMLVEGEAVTPRDSSAVKFLAEPDCKLAEEEAEMSRDSSAVVFLEQPAVLHMCIPVEVEEREAAAQLDTRIAGRPVVHTSDWYQAEGIPSTAAALLAVGLAGRSDSRLHKPIDWPAWHLVPHLGHHT